MRPLDEADHGTTFPETGVVGVFDPACLQEVIHGRARLAVLALLSTIGHADFVTIRHEIGISDGNLSQHLKKLEDAGYVRLDRTFTAGRSRTVIYLTSQGRTAFYDYVDNLRALLSHIPARQA